MQSLLDLYRTNKYLYAHITDNVTKKIALPCQGNLIAGDIGKLFKESEKNNNVIKITDDEIEMLNGLSSFKTIKQIYNDFINPSLTIYDYKNIPAHIQYVHHNHLIKTNCHFGQRKLLLSEIEYYSILDRNINYLIIYPGSASCEHLPVILKLFPNLKFILIDPNYHALDATYPFKYIYQNRSIISKSNNKSYMRNLKRVTTKNNFFRKRSMHLNRITLLLLHVAFIGSDKKYNVLDLENNNDEIKSIMDKFMANSDDLVLDIYDDSDRVFVIQDYMSTDLSIRIRAAYDKYKKTGKQIKLCFLSDIRTALFGGNGPQDLDVLWNYALQIIFIKILKPQYSMTKFRPPWFDPSQGFGKQINKLFDQYNKSENITEPVSSTVTETTSATPNPKESEIEGTPNPKSFGFGLALSQESEIEGTPNPKSFGFGLALSQESEIEGTPNPKSFGFGLALSQESEIEGTDSDSNPDSNPDSNSVQASGQDSDQDSVLGIKFKDVFQMIKRDFDFVKTHYGIDMFGEYMKGKLYYFFNDFIYTQAWAPPSSSESRLFVAKKNINTFIQYDNKEWDNKFYYLRFIRSFAYFGIFHSILKKNKHNDYDGCYDCYRELLILGNFLLSTGNKKLRFGDPIDIQEIETIIRSSGHQVQELYELINKYVFYDLKPNFKCQFHHNITKKPQYITAKFVGNEYQFIYEVRIDENTDIITKKDILYKYDYKGTDIQKYMDD
jgi:hypothetical protein